MVFGAGGDHRCPTSTSDDTPVRRIQCLQCERTPHPDLLHLEQTSHYRLASSHVPRLLHHHLHMHQHTHLHGFTAAPAPGPGPGPALHHPPTLLPAQLGAQHDSQFHTLLHRGAGRPSFAPVTVFHRATQKSSRGTKRGRWAALHVTIAWKIFHHKRLLKMQKKSSSDRTSSSPPDPGQREESDQTKPDSVCGPPRKAADTLPEPKTSCACEPPAKREELDCKKAEQRRERLTAEEKAPHSDAAQDSPARDRSSDPATTPEPGSRRSGSADRRRPLESDSTVKAKRLKHGAADSPAYHADPCSRAQYVSSFSASRCGLTRTPGLLVSYPAGIQAYPTASWDPQWDAHRRLELHLRQNALKDHSVTPGKAIGIPPAAQRQLEAFQGFHAPPLYSPLALRQQDTVYLRGREYLQSRHENCHLQLRRLQCPHPGFLASPYLRP